MELCRLKGADKVFVLTDGNVDALTGTLFEGCPRLVVSAGEGSKSVAGLEKVWNFLVENGALRRSILINVGGGMITDLGGFAAATFKRGIGCVNVPTTLLGAVDAAIGGKTGINFAGLKNEVGAFALPLGVFPLTSLFDSLPKSEWLSGVGEAIKTGMLVSEKLFHLACSKEFIVKRDPEIVEKVVEECAEFKSRIVEEDFREGNKRKILNLGHTAGHAIEEWIMANHRDMPHGVAVAHGLLHTLRKSVEEQGLNREILDYYAQILERYFPPLEMTEREWEEASAYMAHDKKNTEVGKPSWVLLKDIGYPVL